MTDIKDDDDLTSLVLREAESDKCIEASGKRYVYLRKTDSTYRCSYDGYCMFKEDGGLHHSYCSLLEYVRLNTQKW